MPLSLTVIELLLEIRQDNPWGIARGSCLNCELVKMSGHCMADPAPKSMVFKWLKHFEQVKN